MLLLTHIIGSDLYVMFFAAQSNVLLMGIMYMLIEAAEEEQRFQQFRERNRMHHVSYVGTVGKLMS